MGLWGCGNLWEQNKLKATGLEHQHVKEEVFGGTRRLCPKTIFALIRIFGYNLQGWEGVTEEWSEQQQE